MTGFIEAKLPDSLACSYLCSVYLRTVSFTTPIENTVKVPFTHSFHSQVCVFSDDSGLTQIILMGEQSVNLPLLSLQPPYSIIYSPDSKNLDSYSFFVLHALCFSTFNMKLSNGCYIKVPSLSFNLSSNCSYSLVLIHCDWQDIDPNFLISNMTGKQH